MKDNNSPRYNLTNCTIEQFNQATNLPHVVKRYMHTKNIMDIEYRLGSTLIGNKSDIMTRGKATDIYLHLTFQALQLIGVH